MILRFVRLSPSRLREGLEVGTNKQTPARGQAHPRPLPQAGGEKI